MLLSKMQHEVYLITHARVRSSIEKNSNIPQSNIFYIPDTCLHKALFKIDCLLPNRIGLVSTGVLMHIVTQFYQWRLAKKVIKLKKIDIVHEPAPVSPVQPSAMFGLGVPVIIGPMNGGMSFPPAFKDMTGRFENLLYKCVRLFNSVYNLLIPGKFFAKVLLVANKRTLNALPKFRLGKAIILVENGVFNALDKRVNSDLMMLDVNGEAKKPTLKVLYVGRLVDWKRIDILIDAFARCKNTEAELIIVGDGPLRHELTLYAKNASNRIRLTGAVPHDQINAIYDIADIFVLPSIRECGGAVVLEAMARGLPVIATEWGGPADYIAEGTGLLVAPNSQAYMIEKFAQHIDALLEDQQLRTKIGNAAISHVKQHFLWQKKVDNIITIYESLLKVPQ